ncbi:MAG: hypothetical protein ACTSVV_04720 [Promethearchaeota archaeon]
MKTIDSKLQEKDLENLRLKEELLAIKSKKREIKRKLREIPPRNQEITRSGSKKEDNALGWRKT